MTTNFKQFNPNAANIQSDSTYNGDSLRSGGITTNAILASKLLNKLFYQVSIMVAALAQSLSDKGYSPDDGNASPSTALTNLKGILSNLLTNADLPGLALGTGTVFDRSSALSSTVLLTNPVATGVAMYAVSFHVFIENANGASACNIQLHITWFDSLFGTYQYDAPAITNPTNGVFVQGTANVRCGGFNNGAPGDQIKYFITYSSTGGPVSYGVYLAATRLISS